MPRPLARSLCLLLGALLALGLTQTACSDPEEDDTPEDNNASSNTTSSNNASNSTNNTQPHEADHCDDGEDNDGDGLADCEDEDCRGVGACPDWSCVDVDLGSALGRPVTDITAVGRGDDLDDECLSDAEDVVFRWTAPHAGLFTFDISWDSAPSRTPPALEVRRGGCGEVEGRCGLSPSSSGEPGRATVVLRLEAQEGVALGVEGGVVLGIAERELPATLAGQVLSTSFVAGVDPMPDLDGDGYGELSLRAEGSDHEIWSIFPSDTPRYQGVYRAAWPIYEAELRPYPLYQAAPDFLATYWMPRAVGDFDADGRLEVVLANFVEAGRMHRYVTPMPTEVPWVDEVLEVWRPVVAQGDLTGDGVPELVVWRRDPAFSGSNVADGWEVFHAAPDVFSPQAQALLTLPGQPYYRPAGPTAAVCDFDGDGINDLLTVDDRPQEPLTVRLYPGPLGAGTTLADAQVLEGFQPVFSFDYTAPLVVGDLTGDGRCDLITPTVQGLAVFAGPLGTSLGWEHANLLFTPDVENHHQSIASVGISYNVGDLNGDGSLDLVFGAQQRDGAPGLDLASVGGFAFVFYGPLVAEGTLDPFTADLILTCYEQLPNSTDDAPSVNAHIHLVDLDRDELDELIIVDFSLDRTLIFPGARLTSGEYGRRLP